MEKKPTKRALQAQETKRKIYRCGAELFRKYGYQNVSVEQIAQAAGVGIGTLYHYYPSKADLYGEMFIRADDFFSAFEDAAALQKPPEEVLMEYFRQYARLNEGMGVEYVQLLVSPQNREVFQGNQNFELNAFIYEEATACRLRDLFVRDKEKCEELTLEAWSNRRRWDKLKESVARLFSPLQ